MEKMHPTVSDQICYYIMNITIGSRESNLNPLYLLLFSEMNICYQRLFIVEVFCHLWRFLLGICNRTHFLHLNWNTCRCKLKVKMYPSSPSLLYTIIQKTIVYNYQHCIHTHTHTYAYAKEYYIISPNNISSGSLT